MLRVMIAAVVLLGFGTVLSMFDDRIGPWGQLGVVIAGMFAVSAVLPHYLYRGEPLLPNRRKRR